MEYFEEVIVNFSEKASKPSKEKLEKHEKPEDFKKYDIPELEKNAVDIAGKAVLAFHNAVDELRSEVDKIMKFPRRIN